MSVHVRSCRSGRVCGFAASLLLLSCLSYSLYAPWTSPSWRRPSRPYFFRVSVNCHVVSKAVRSWSCARLRRPRRYALSVSLLSYVPWECPRRRRAAMMSPMSIADLIASSYRSLIENGSDDFKACLLAGVSMSFSSEWKDGGLTITATTVDPCAVRHEAGRVVVYTRKSS